MTTQTDTAVAPAAKSSRWEDFIDVIFSPSELFRRRATESWVRPFLIVCAVQIVLYYLLLPVTGPVIEASMIESAPPGTDLAQVQQGAAFMKWLFGALTPIWFLVLVAGTALAIKLVSALLEPGASWKQSFLIATLSLYITVLQSVVVSIAIFIKSMMGGAARGADASFGLLRFIDVPATDAVMRALLGRTDLFAIWSAVLIGIGLIVLVNMSRGKAIVTAAIVWALIALPQLAGAAFS